jgi:NADPH:quinone reductase
VIAVEISSPGPPDVLRAVERAMPVVGPGEVLIRVAAAGVNRPDVMQRKGKYPPPPGASDIPGLEVSGTIEAVAPDVQSWHPGEQVCALVSGGGYAEYCTAAAGLCLPLPANVDLVSAAAIPETTFTVWSNMVERGKLIAGETVLVHGGTSGIGTTAIQIAHAIGARVITTAGTAEKCQACLDLGADVAVNYREADFVAVAMDATNGRGVDVVLDIVGGDYFQRNLDVLAMDGRLLLIGQLGGHTSQIVSTPIFRRRLTVTGSVLRSRPVAEKQVIADAVRQHVWPMFESGAVKVLVHATYPLVNAAEAHRVMEASQHVSKLVLTTGR